MSNVSMHALCMHMNVSMTQNMLALFVLGCIAYIFVFFFFCGLVLISTSIFQGEIVSAR